MRACDTNFERQNMHDSKEKELVSKAEWQLRCDLAAAYRLVQLFGWDDLVFTHISARVPTSTHEQHFLINPYGFLFEEITASSLVKVDAHGNKVPLPDGSVPSNPINPAGFTIHSAVHAGRHDAICVMHTHSINGIAVSAQKQGVLPISQQSLFVLASLGYHNYEGVALNEAEKPRLAVDLAQNAFLMLRNHGLLTVGASISDAFLQMYIFEAACMIQVRASAGQAPTDLLQIHPQILAGIQAQAAEVTKGLGSALVWPGLLRRLQRKNPGYDV
jgi:ribulose-5-phosphate 4-epimerase/fuculose-1-phosphate aldolase